MSYIDILIVMLIIATGFIGYKNGLFKELYNLIIIMLALLLSFIFQHSIGTIVINNININSLVNNQLFVFFEDSIVNYIGFFVAYLIIYLILKVLTYILIRRNILPNNREFFRYGGAIINVIEALFMISVLGFLLSFGLYINIYQYRDSFLLKKIYKLNYPLYSYGNKLHTIIGNLNNISNKISEYKEDPNILLTDEDSVETIKLLFETGIINEDFVVEGSKVLFKNINKNEIDFSIINFVEVKNNEKFKQFKDLYREDIITEKLLRRIVEENDLTDFDINGLIQALEE